MDRFRSPSNADSASRRRFPKTVPGPSAGKDLDGSVYEWSEGGSSMTTSPQRRKIGKRKTSKLVVVSPPKKESGVCSVDQVLSMVTKMNGKRGRESSESSDEGEEEEEVKDCRRNTRSRKENGVTSTGPLKKQQLNNLVAGLFPMLSPGKKEEAPRKKNGFQNGAKEGQTPPRKTKRWWRSSNSESIAEAAEGIPMFSPEGRGGSLQGKVASVHSSPRTRSRKDAEGVAKEVLPVSKKNAMSTTPSQNGRKRKESGGMDIASEIFPVLNSTRVTRRSQGKDRGRLEDVSSTPPMRGRPSREELESIVEDAMSKYISQATPKKKAKENGHSSEHTSPIKKGRLSIAETVSSECTSPVKRGRWRRESITEAVLSECTSPVKRRRQGAAKEALSGYTTPEDRASSQMDHTTPKRKRVEEMLVRKRGRPRKLTPPKSPVVAKSPVGAKSPVRFTRSRVKSLVLSRSPVSRVMRETSPIPTRMKSSRSGIKFNSRSSVKSPVLPKSPVITRRLRNKLVEVATLPIACEENQVERVCESSDGKVIDPPKRRGRPRKESVKEREDAPPIASQRKAGLRTPLRKESAKKREDGPPIASQRKAGLRTPRKRLNMDMAFKLSDEDSVFGSDVDEDLEESYSEFEEKEFASHLPLKRKGQRRRGARKKDHDSELSEEEEEPMKTTTTPRKRKTKQLCLAIPDREVRGSGKKGKTNAKFETVRERLHVSAVPHVLPCREDEFFDIYNYVEGKLAAGTGGCMYISGMPGTGKTATVMGVATSLRQAEAEGSLPSFQFIEINGMRLSEPRQAYVSILKQLTGEKAAPDRACAKLEAFFSSKRGRIPTVLLADELDMFSTRNQKVLYHLLDWPSWQTSHLVVLAVANTMDLPERVMQNKVSSRMGLTRLTFEPYSFQQLQEIVRARIGKLHLFDNDVLELAVRKVAAVSGDIRRALDLLLRAIEIAQSNEKCKLVKLTHLQQAIQEMFSSPKILAIKHASLYEKLFLKGVLAEFKRSGVEEATFREVCARVNEVFAVEGVKGVSYSVLDEVCSRLGVCHILLVEGGNKDIHRRIQLNISQSDVVLALRETSSS